jgi:hemolysin III
LEFHAEGIRRVASVTQSRNEEIANTVSHGVGFLAAVAGIPLLVLSGLQKGGSAAVVGGAIFGTTMALLYLTSTLYHAVPPGPAKQLLRRLDHSAIFLLIAGTYTPFTLGVLGGGWGWSLFGVVWGIAVIGIFFKLVYGVRFPKVSATMYLAMGWLVVVAIRPLWLNLPGWGMFLLVLGGLAYSLGLVFYLNPKIRFGHFVWHLFVLAGTTFHFFSVLLYAA